jgi:hypothetical protein
VDGITGETEDQMRSEKQKIVVVHTDVEAGVKSLIDNAYFGDVGELDSEDLQEIVLLVLSYATRGIREIERRAGREDAAQDIERVARSTRESLVCTPPEYAGEAAYHRTRAVAFERAAVIARGDGVQPTEEQRARNEDQERDEED